MFSQFFSRNIKLFPVIVAFSFNTEYFRRKFYTPEYVQALSYPTTKDRIRGEYENKIRMFSSPEKIFEIFATVKKNDILYMSFNDLFRAICPFNYSDKNEKPIEINENSAIIKMVDINNDGLIDIYEYMILVSFLQISKKEIMEYFQKNFPNKNLTKDGLKTFLYYLRDQTKIKLTMTGILPDPRKVHLSKEKYEESIHKVIENIFIYQKEITTEYILKMKNDLLHEIYDFEFKSYPSLNKNKINEEDFAKSIVCFLEIPTITSHLKHLEGFSFSDEMITLQNYCDFHQFFKDNYNKLENELNNRGTLTKKRLEKMISEFCSKNGTKITNRQLEIFIYILDINGDNKIDVKEFLGVLKNRSFYGSAESHTLNQPLVSLNRFWEKSVDKMNRIYEILKE